MRAWVLAVALLLLVTSVCADDASDGKALGIAAIVVGSVAILILVSVVIWYSAGCGLYGRSHHHHHEGVERHGSQVPAVRQSLVMQPMGKRAVSGGMSTATDIDL